MIKRIIFDIDNTLLNTTKDCLDAYREFCKNNYLPFSSYDIYNAIGEYENNNGSYDKSDITKFLSNKFNYKFDFELYERLQNVYSKHATLININTLDILSKLKNKYELVALSNWYLEPQTNRLKNSGIYDCFSEVYAIENCGIKPNKEVFLKACGKNKVEEVLIIGDNYDIDLKVPIKMGMQVIGFNIDKKKAKCNNIKSLDELLKGDLL